MPRYYSKQIVLSLFDDELSRKEGYYQQKWNKRTLKEENIDFDYYYLKSNIPNEWGIFSKDNWINKTPNSTKSIFESLSSLDYNSRIYIDAHGSSGSSYLTHDANENLHISAYKLSEMLAKNLKKENLNPIDVSSSRKLRISLVACLTASGNSKNIMGGKKGIGIPKDSFAYQFISNLHDLHQIDCEVLARRSKMGFKKMGDNYVKFILDGDYSKGLHHKKNSKVMIYYHNNKLIVSDDSNSIKVNSPDIIISDLIDFSLELQRENKIEKYEVVKNLIETYFLQSNDNSLLIYDILFLENELTAVLNNKIINKNEGFNIRKHTNTYRTLKGILDEVKEVKKRIAI